MRNVQTDTNINVNENSLELRKFVHTNIINDSENTSMAKPENNTEISRISIVAHYSVIIKKTRFSNRTFHYVLNFQGGNCYIQTCLVCKIYLFSHQGGTRSDCKSDLDKIILWFIEHPKKRCCNNSL